MTLNAASLQEVKILDAKDPLRSLRDHFDLPEGMIYLDGNSLGPPPIDALKRLQKTADVEWKRDLITSWNKADWIHLPKTCGAKIAALIGARADEVIVADSVSVNIFKLASAIWKNNPGAIAYPNGEFPTDGYILQGLSALTDAALKRIDDDAPEFLTDDIRVFVKSVTHYKTAAVADIAAWETAASKKGVSIIWDLSHAAGVLDINLKAAGARFAVGCGYKFLNGGPGAPAYVFADKKEAENLRQPLSGWMGHAAPFEFSEQYEPGRGVERFACGTPPILSLSVMDAALDVFENVSMADLETKAAALGDLFLARSNLLNLASIAPPPGTRRGGHISLRHPNGYEIVQAMIAKGVIGDFRAPDIMRFGFSPLYTRYEDIWSAMDILEEILAKETWRDPAFANRQTVT